MPYKEYNNNFLGYHGYIGRKNYIINMLVLIVIFLGLSFTKFENFLPYITYEFLYNALLFVVSFFKIVIIVSIISIVYRRIADFSEDKSQNFKLNMQRIFVIFFVFPFFYIFCRYFINIVPIITLILDILTTFILIPIGIISSVIFSFIKGS